MYKKGNPLSYRLSNPPFIEPLSIDLILKTPIFIDFEASSLSLLDSYPIEVGICMGNGTTKSWLIKPHVLWKDWSAESEKIHGIPREALVENGENIRAVANELNHLLTTEEVYCDAISHDSFWLHRLFRASGIKASFNLESLIALLNLDKRALWQSTRQKIIADQSIITHRAGTDAMILHKTWQALQA